MSFKVRVEEITLQEMPNAIGFTFEPEDPQVVLSNQDIIDALSDYLMIRDHYIHFSKKGLH